MKAANAFSACVGEIQERYGVVSDYFFVLLDAAYGLLEDDGAGMVDGYGDENGMLYEAANGHGTCALATEDRAGAVEMLREGGAASGEWGIA